MRKGVIMKLSRRDFLKYCVASAAALGLDNSALGRLEKALAGGGPTVIWLNGANCTGCTVSLANRVATSGTVPNVSDPSDLPDLLINHIDLAFHPNLMGAAGDLAVANLEQAVAKGNYILAIDGGIPTAFDGHVCMLWTDSFGNEVTALDAVQSLAPGAAKVLSIGTCASFGGIPAGNPNPTQIQSVKTVSGRQDTINIPGCPPHPDWIVWTIAQLLAGKSPALDSWGRPSTLFAKKVHDRCPRKERDEAKTFGIEGACLKELGCKGPETKADCPDRLWNNKTNWCVGANAHCLGCTESGFPDKFSPFYKRENED